MREMIYYAYMKFMASYDKSLTDTIAIKAAEIGDIQFQFVLTGSATEYTAKYITIMPDFLLLQSRLVTDKATQDVLQCLMCVVIRVVMQTLGKQVTDDNVSVWFKNRFRAAAARHVTTEQWDEYRPSTATMQLAHKAMGQMFAFRRMVVDRFFHYQASPTRFGEMFSLILSMIACTDITHVVNINVYLMKTMPELLNLQMLRPYDDQLITMYESWNKHKHYFAYVRFYISPEECHPINRHNLTPLIIASHVVATYTSSTFRNYKGAQTDSDLYKHINQIVSRYIRLHHDVSMIALGLSERALMSSIERTLVMEGHSIAPPADSEALLMRDLENITQEASTCSSSICVLSSIYHVTIY